MNVKCLLSLGPLDRSTPPDAAMLVLVPGPFGGLDAYQRRGAGRLQEPYRVEDTEHLARCVQRAAHKTVVLCGSRYAKPVRAAVGGHADLFVVPLAWLRAIPGCDQDHLASFAARLVTAHRRAPIQQICRAETALFPF